MFGVVACRQRALNTQHSTHTQKICTRCTAPIMCYGYGCLIRRCVGHTHTRPRPRCNAVVFVNAAARARARAKEHGGAQTCCVHAHSRARALVLLVLRGAAHIWQKQTTHGRTMGCTQFARASTSHRRVRCTRARARVSMIYDRQRASKRASERAGAARVCALCKTLR